MEEFKRRIIVNYYKEEIVHNGENREEWENDYLIKREMFMKWMENKVGSWMKYLM